MKMSELVEETGFSKTIQALHLSLAQLYAQQVLLSGHSVGTLRRMMT